MTVLKKSDLIKPGALKYAPHERGDWFVWVENNVTRDMILAPGFWAHHHAALKAGARIEVVRQDLTLDIELRVLKSEPGLVYTRVVREHVDDTDLAAQASAVTGEGEFRVPPGYKVGYAPKGEKPGHFVHSQLTGSPVVRGLTSRRDAIAFARKHFLEANPGGDIDKAIAEAEAEAEARKNAA